MSKFSSPTLAQTQRLLNLVPFLSTHQQIEISQLSTEFNVSKKEILDDLNTLWMCGLPGYTPLELIDLSFDDGFVTIRNAEILETPRSLTTEEAVALILGLDLLGRYESSLTTEINELQNKLRKIVGDFVRAIPTINSGHRANISQAIRERKNLELTYFSPISDDITQREVTPLEIQNLNDNEYLLAMTSKGVRNFRLDRVSEVTILETFEDFTLSQSENATEQLMVELKISKNYRQVAELFNLDFNSISQDLDGIQLATGFSQEWFVRAVMSQGSGVEVLAPETLRKEIHDRCSELLNFYENGELPK